MKTKKILTMLLSGALAISTLAGCGGGSSTTSTGGSSTDTSAESSAS